VEEIKTSIVLERGLHDRLNIALPRGLRAQVTRELYLMFLSSVKEYGSYIIQDILDGKASIKSSNRNLASLKVSEKQL